LLTTDANIQKRIERVRDRLRELDVDFDTPAAAQLGARLDAVLAVIYLLFSQGCHVTHGDTPIRRDLCGEARRLGRMLASQSAGDDPAVHALLALMCFHGARFDARVDLDGAIVLLEEQDRSAWNWSDVREGMAWLARSAAGDEVTRYHVEAGIAWEHCRALTFADTDWRRIAELYDTLDRIAPSPLLSLNRAVAEAYLHGPQAGLDRLAAVLPTRVPARYPGWHTVIGELHYRLGQLSAAERAWREALRLTTARADREFLHRRLAACRSGGGEPATE
jgi:RNA polymerase sigma-70 factor (ECF subfamily)